MRKLKKYTGLWAYLSKLEGFESFTEEQIKLAKQTYWREYDKLRKQNSRTKQKRELVIVFHEIKHVRVTAKAKGLSVHEYIRACVNADMAHMTVIPHSSLVKEIRQLLRQCYNQLEFIKQKETKNWLSIGTKNLENVDVVLKQVDSGLSDLLEQPKTLRDTIIEAINRNPSALQLLKTIIAEYDHQVHDEKNSIIPPAH